MSILQETFTESLNAGASPITYEGEEGREQQVAQAIWDKLPPQARMQFGSFAQFFSSGAWKKVLAALQQQMQGGQEEIQETETVEAAPQQGLGSMMPGPRTMAHGGIMNAAPRQGYFLGDIVRAVTKPVKKVLKSDLGKAALLYAGTAGLGNILQPGAAQWANMKWLAPKTVAANWLGSRPDNFIGPLTKAQTGILGNWNLTKGGGSLMPSALGWGAAATAAPFAMQATGNWEADETFDNLKLKAAKFGFNYEQMIRDIQNAEDEEEYLAVLAQYNLSPTDLPPWDSQKRAEGGRIGYAEGGDDVEWRKIYNKYKAKQIALGQEFASFEEFIDQHRVNEAQGGRIGAQEGGLMDLGGMEKDYRNDGGFVPIGEYEKKDDVPARLSKNEFVFTADAVRGAGGGDINRGAEVMENVMKNLERGGEISEESQGLEGARDMFQVSERLSEVV